MSLKTLVAAQHPLHHLLSTIASIVGEEDPHCIKRLSASMNKYAIRYSTDMGKRINLLEFNLILNAKGICRRLRFLKKEAPVA